MGHVTAQHHGWTRADERAWVGEDGRMTLNIAVIPGDGIGKEIVPEGLKVLDCVLADKDVDY